MEIWTKFTKKGTKVSGKKWDKMYEKGVKSLGETFDRSLRKHDNNRLAGVRPVSELQNFTTSSSPHENPELYKETI